MATEFQTFFRDSNSKNTKYNRLMKVVEDETDEAKKAVLSEMFDEVRRAIREWDEVVLNGLHPAKRELDSKAAEAF